MKTTRYVGPWACVACGMRLWASALPQEPRPLSRCRACARGRMVPERRIDQRPRRNERRKAFTATL